LYSPWCHGFLSLSLPCLEQVTCQPSKFPMPLPLRCYALPCCGRSCACENVFNFSPAHAYVTTGHGVTTCVPSARQAPMTTMLSRLPHVESKSMNSNICVAEPHGGAGWQTSSRITLSTYIVIASCCGLAAESRMRWSSGFASQRRTPAQPKVRHASGSVFQN
jgi:hypothetical protein